MKTTTITSIIIVTLLMVFGAACVKSQSGSATIDPAKLKMFKPVADVVAPKDGTLTEEKVALGRMLYYDTRL